MAGMADKMQEWRGVKMPRLKEIRKQQEISRVQLAKDTGLNHSFIWRIEERGNGVGEESAQVIATRLGVSVNDLTQESVNALL